MAVASLLAEAVANFLPARAPGVPAWPSSFRVFRDFRGCSVIASAPLCSGMLTRSFPLVSPLRGRLRLSPESGYPCRLGALPGPYIRLMLTRSSHSSRPSRAAFGSLPCGCPHRLGPLDSALARGCSAFSSAIRFRALLSVLSPQLSVLSHRPKAKSSGLLKCLFGTSKWQSALIECHSGLSKSHSASPESYFGPSK
jgi:hypothetical protein